MYKYLTVAEYESHGGFDTVEVVYTSKEELQKELTALKDDKEFSIVSVYELKDITKETIK